MVHKEGEKNRQETHFLPITRKEMEYLGWDYVDVILISGDAYVDHPSFAAAVIGRVLEREGLRVAILPQPNWRDDLRDFKKLGIPRLFFGVTAGNMDSMVNHYTAYKRLRSDDAYTAGNVAGFRPDYASVVYTQILKRLFPEVPVVLGGVEASMRRLSHYDYWSDTLKPSILVDSGADYLVYGMGERPIVAIAEAFQSENRDEQVRKIPQVAYFTKDKSDLQSSDLLLNPYEAELKDKRTYAESFIRFERESNKVQQRRMVQPTRQGWVVVNPPFPPATTEEMDHFSLFDRMKNAPHPKYKKRGDIPAFEMIKNSINIHRGCFGGCSFCAIAAHQGKQVVSRSESSVLAEVRDLVSRDYFKGHISDLGGPSANMYRMRGRDLTLCAECQRDSCIFPKKCKNLNANHFPLIELYRKCMKISGVRHITIGSGIRYDMLLTEDKREDLENGYTEYLNQVTAHHVSGRLKVAPEHTDPSVLRRMRKPDFRNFELFLNRFVKANQQAGKNQQLIPYLISSFPGCTLENMAQLAVKCKENNLITDQVQDFTPTPMTFATALYYLGFDPYTGEKIPVAKSVDDKRNQHLFFFYKKPENREKVAALLTKIHRQDLKRKLF